MTILHLQINPSLHSKRTDFNARVKGESLELPTELAQYVRRNRVRNANQLMSMLFTFPTSFADELGWALSDIEAARSRLVVQLSGKIPEGYLKPVRRRRVIGGAVRPGAEEPEEAY